MAYDTDPEIQAIFRRGGNPQLHALQVQTILVDRITQALAKHADALVRASDAANKYAMWIGIATIALVFSTLALVWATLQMGG